MKKILFIIALLLSGENAKAQNVEFWSRVYGQVQQVYIDEVKIEDLAVATLKQAKKIDKNITVANDDSRISVYYKGRVGGVIKKPKDDNIKDWAELTDKVGEIIKQKSAKAQIEDYKNNNIMASGMLKVLDKDSKYYDDEDELNATGIKNKRLFASRKEDNILYMKIKLFNKQSFYEITNAINEYKDFDAIVFDLRNCAGGMAGEVINIAELFLDGGIIISTRGKKHNEEIFYPAKEGDIIKGKKIYILVDENTASSAEILAVALQEQGRAKIIGSKTKGKGTMQQLVYLENGAVLAVTNALFYSPSGKEINLKGINPDICSSDKDKETEIADLIKNKKPCYKDELENSELEMKIVKYLMKNN